MTLEDLGNIGELVSAIAVVISLVYLARQIHYNTAQLGQNTETVRAATELDAARLIADFSAWFAERPDIVEIWRKGLTSEEMSPEEGIRFYPILMNLFLRLEGLFHQVRRGFLSEDSWAAWDGVILFYVAQPSVLRWWRDKPPPFPFSSEFVKHVDQLIEDNVEKLDGSSSA